MKGGKSTKMDYRAFSYALADIERVGHWIFGDWHAYDGIRKLYRHGCLLGFRFGFRMAHGRQDSTSRSWDVVSRNWSARYSFKGRFNVDEKRCERPGWKVSHWKKIWSRCDYGTLDVMVSRFYWSWFYWTVLSKHCVWSCFDSCFPTKFNWSGKDQNWRETNL